MWHQMGGSGGHGMGMGQGHAMGSPNMDQMGHMPAATAKVESLDHGARLVLTANDKSQLEALRKHARQHQQRMGNGECWMLQQNEAGSEQKPNK